MMVRFDQSNCVPLVASSLRFHAHRDQYRTRQVYGIIGVNAWMPNIVRFLSVHVPIEPRDLIVCNFLLSEVTISPLVVVAPQ